MQFRRTLLDKCQEEFEAGVTAMKAVSEREKHAKETGEVPPQESQVRCCRAERWWSGWRACGSLWM